MSKQRYLTAGVTIAAAALTAHIMQSGGQSDPRTAAISTAASAAPVLPESVRPSVTQQAGNDVTLLVPEVQPSQVETPQDAPGAVQALLPVPQKDEPPSTAIAAVVPGLPLAVAPALPIKSAPDLPVPVAEPDPIPIQASLPVEAIPIEVSTPEATAAGPVAPLLPTDTLLPTPLPISEADLPGRVATLEDTLELPLADEPERNEFGLTCGPTLSARASDEALVTLTLTAPCRGEDRIHIRHGALEFTGMVDSLGSYQVRLPAMSSNAAFTVTFADDSLFSTTIDVPNVAEFERVALVSNAGSGLQIHALEFGAQYGDPGHVWAEAPGDPMLAPLEGKGFMLQLGDDSVEDPILAEIYTFPRDGASQSGVVRLSVEAEVTLANCASEVSGHTVEPGLDGRPNPIAMTVEMPGCEAVGEYLVLKNLLRDLRIASR